MSIEEEIAELEKEANDPLLILSNHGEFRYTRPEPYAFVQFLEQTRRSTTQ